MWFLKIVHHIDILTGKNRNTKFRFCLWILDIPSQWLLNGDVSNCVQNNGDASDSFSLEPGSKQGCPLSSYLFVFWVETLGSAVRNDNEIRGLIVLEAESKFSQCAEDTTLIFDGSESSFSRSLLILDTFALISGLKVFGLVRLKTSETTISSSKPILRAKEKYMF